MTHRFLPACSLVITVVLAACGKQPAVQMAGGDVERGRQAVERFGCIACHYIPGSANQGSNVGPPLTHIAKRAYLGGVIANTPDNMVQWLRNPPQVDPRTAMPNLGISQEQAIDIAAYLYTLQ